MHVLNRVLLTLLALALVVLGVSTAVEAVRAGLGQPGVVVDRSAAASTLSEGSWSDPAWIAVAVGLAVLGLVLLVVQLTRRPPDEFPVGDQEGPVRLAYTRQGLERLITHVAGEHDDVASVHGVTVRRRRAEVDVRAYPGASPDAVDGAVEEAVGQRLKALDLRSTPRVRAHATVGDRRTR